MNRNILLSVVVLFSFVGLVKGQESIYYMDWDGGGRGEFICNAKKYLDYWGIGLVSGSIMRATINNSGRTLFVNPRSTVSSDLLNKLNANLNKNDNVSIGTNGFIVGKGFQLRDLENNNDSIMMGWGFDPRTGDPTLVNVSSRKLRFGSPGGFHFWSNGKVLADDNPQVSITNNGLQVNGHFNLSDENGIQIYTGKTADKKDAWIGTTSNNGLYIGANNAALIYLDASQNLYIGTNGDFAKTVKQELKDKYNLFVTKGILSEDFAIAPKSSWADYVFSKEYKLLSLAEVECFIKANKHLPDVPSEKEVAENGYSQHDVNKALLQKVEELTLYVIELQKQIEILKEKETE